jgi:two-component system response regulator VicR
VERTSGMATERPPEDDLRFDDLIIRPRLHVVERDGVSIELSANEFDLLYFLASHPRQVFTRQQLLNSVWQYDYLGDSSTVTVHMSRLRKKVELDPANPRHLRTVWNIGYKFEP